MKLRDLFLVGACESPGYTNERIREIGDIS